MTREEAIKYLRQIYPNGGHCWLDNQRIDALQIAIDVLSQPFIPVGLDEAAEEYANRNCHNYLDNESDWDEICLAFRNGVEWAVNNQTIKTK